MLVFHLTLNQFFFYPHLCFRPTFLLKFHIRIKILFLTSSLCSHIIFSSHWITPHLSLRSLVPCIYFLHIPKALFCYLCITVLGLVGHMECLKLQIQSFNFPIWYPIDQSNKNSSFEKTPIQLLHVSCGICRVQKKISLIFLWNSVSLYWANASCSFLKKNVVILIR